VTSLLHFHVPEAAYLFQQTKSNISLRVCLKLIAGVLFSANGVTLAGPGCQRAFVVTVRAFKITVLNIKSRKSVILQQRYVKMHCIFYFDSKLTRKYHWFPNDIKSRSCSKQFPNNENVFRR